MKKQSHPQLLVALSTMANQRLRPHVWPAGGGAGDTVSSACPTTDDWIKKPRRTQNTYNGLSLSYRRRNVAMVTTWLDLETIMLSEMSQAEKVANHMMSLLCRIET